MLMREPHMIQHPIAVSLLSSVLYRLCTCVQVLFTVVTRDEKYKAKLVGGCNVCLHSMHSWSPIPLLPPMYRLCYWQPVADVCVQLQLQWTGCLGAGGCMPKSRRRHTRQACRTGADMPASFLELTALLLSWMCTDYSQAIDAVIQRLGDTLAAGAFEILGRRATQFDSVCIRLPRDVASACL
jgi:hypothetical protein